MRMEDNFDWDKIDPQMAFMAGWDAGGEGLRLTDAIEKYKENHQKINPPT